MNDFRDRTCGECAWHRKITWSDYYGRNIKFQCTNAACCLPDVSVPKATTACPAFVPSQKGFIESNCSVLESKDE